MEELDKIRESEEANYQTSRRVLGESVTLVEDLLDLYRVLGEMIRGSRLGPRDEIVCAGQFLLGCRYQLTLGALAALRGHLHDSFMLSRKAIELCAFAARVKRHSHLAMIWLCAGDSDAAYDAYREKFAPGKLFPEDHEILGKLGERYDHCSKLTHPSVYSLAGHIETERRANEVAFRFHYFQLKGSDPSEPAWTFFWIVDTHFGILRLFEEVFADAIAHDRPAWEIQRNGVDAKIGVHKERWKKVILGS